MFSARTYIGSANNSGVTHGSYGGADGAAPDIPPKINRRWKPCFPPALYRGRNAIERMFGRLKDFRRIATRYDRPATNYSPPSASPPPSATGYESGR